MLDGFFDALKIYAEVLNVLEQPALFSVEPLQKMSELVMSSFPGKKILKEEGNQKLWSPIVNHGVERVDEEQEDEGTARHSYAKKLLL